MKILKVLGLAVTSMAVITACGGDDSDSMGMEPTPAPMMTYEVAILNTTHAQPLSPPALLLHRGSHLWSIGSPVSLGLEVLAESGSPVNFMEENGSLESALGSVAASEVLLPGESTVLSITVAEAEHISMTVAAMLVNTNDAFSGITSWDVSSLDVGSREQVLAPVYDAGTEANSETQESVPGPAAGGEGFSSDRDDVNYLARHSGVVSADDGLSDSSLGEQHRFDNGALKITVTRTQ